MDILKKMFGINGSEKDAVTRNKEKEPTAGNEFRKPVWYEEESDDELFDNNKVFGFQVFTNPLEIQKYYEAQMRQMFKSMNEFENNKDLFDENFREEYMKPGYEHVIEKEIQQHKKRIDVDLDDEIYADQLHSLLQRTTPEAHTMIALDALNKNRKAHKEKAIVARPKEVPRKLSDEEKIWNQMHGNADSGAVQSKSANRHNFGHRFPVNSGAFEGMDGGPKTFRQGFTFQMIRKPGLSETRRTVIDKDGNSKTVINRTANGKTETITAYNNAEDNVPAVGQMIPDNQMKSGNNAKASIGNAIVGLDRNLFVTKDGYVLPKDLW